MTYYEDAGKLIADDIELVDDSGGDDLDVVGTVTQLRDDGLTVQVDGQGPMSFEADPDLLDGVSVSDQVDVTYYEDTDGSLVADDVEPADDSGSGNDPGGDAG